MTEFDSIDFFADVSVVNDPSPYFDHLRAKCPVLREAHHGAISVKSGEQGTTFTVDLPLQA